MQKIILWLSAIVVMASCVKTPLSASYYAKPSKTGVIVVTSAMEHNASSSGGLVGAIIADAITSSDKYYDAFKALTPVMKPEEKIKNMYIKAFAARGKEVIYLNDTLNLKSIKNYKPVNKDSDKEYFKVRCGTDGDECYKDLRFLKEKHGIDEVILVFIRLGIYSHYYYGIETVRDGMARLTLKIVDLNDNSIIHDSWATNHSSFDGEWDMPPAYENLKRGIDDAINEVINEEREKYKYK